jgi:hypothetical protein
MPISTMLNGLSSRSVALGEHAHLSGDFARGEIADEAHLAGQAESARHRAADLGGHAEGHRRRVGDEHRLDLPAVGQLEDQLARPVGRTLVAADERRGDGELVLKPGPELAGEVGHLADIVYSAAINPAVDLTGVKRLFTPGHERRFDLAQIELGQSIRLLDCGASRARDIIDFVF